MVFAAKWPQNPVERFCLVDGKKGEKDFVFKVTKFNRCPSEYISKIHKHKAAMCVSVLAKLFGICKTGDSEIWFM
jgi:hypothetical protein